MSNREKDIIKEYRRLQEHGWLASGHKTRIEPNSGSETHKHLMAKVSVCHVLIQEGYRVRTEVEHDSGPICDVLAFGHETREPIVVELETQCDLEQIRRNVDCYKHGVREVYTVDLADTPEHIAEMKQHIRTVIGL